MSATRRLRVCDPWFGSGKMLLRANSYSLCRYGQDIAPLERACTSWAVLRGE